MNNSTLPTMEQMTAVYLFGQLEKPSNLIDENLIRPKDLVVDYPVKININEYMTDGPGRFVSAKDFDFLGDFFEQKSLLSKNLEPGRYTKFEIFKLLNVDTAWIAHSTAQYDDGKDNLLERAYIWNSVAFMINDDAEQGRVGNLLPTRLINFRQPEISLLGSSINYFMWRKFIQVS